MQGFDVDHKEDKYSKYRSLDDEELKKQFDIYKFCVYFSWLIIAIFLAVIISISARADSYKSQVDALNQVVATYTPVTALKLSSVPNSVLSSMVSGNTITIQARQNSSVGVGAVRIYFSASTTTSMYYSTNGTFLASGTGKWNLLEPSGLSFIPDSTSGLPTDEFGDNLLFVYINSIDWVVYSKTTGKLLGMVYHADIVAGNDLDTFSSYKAPNNFQMTMLDSMQIAAFFTGKTIYSRTILTNAPFIKVYHATNGTAFKEILNSDGNVTSSTSGVWGITTDGNGYSIKWDMFYNNNVTNSEVVFSALQGAIQISNSTFAFQGFSYEYELVSGNGL